MTIPLEKVVADAKASLHFLDDQLFFTYYVEGERRYKFVSPAALRSAVSRSPIDSDWISPTVRRCGAGPQGDWAIAWYPPQVRRITIVDEDTRARDVDVPFPGLLFAGAGKGYSVWATKGKEFVRDTALFLAPFPNLGDGSICWGSNRVPPAGASTIDRAFALFVESPFNGHSVTGKSRTHGDDVRKLLFALAKRRAKEFPDDELVPARTNTGRVVASMTGEGYL